MDPPCLGCGVSVARAPRTWGWDPPPVWVDAVGSVSPTHVDGPEPPFRQKPVALVSLTHVG